MLSGSRSRTWESGEEGKGEKMAGLNAPAILKGE